MPRKKYFIVGLQQRSTSFLDGECWTVGNADDYGTNSRDAGDQPVAVRQEFAVHSLCPRLSRTRRMAGRVTRLSKTEADVPISIAYPRNSSG